LIQAASGMAVHGTVFSWRKAARGHHRLNRNDLDAAKYKYGNARLADGQADRDESKELTRGCRSVPEVWQARSCSPCWIRARRPWAIYSAAFEEIIRRT